MKVVTEETYKDIINQDNKLIIVDYAGSWCGPCQILGPKLKEIADSLSGNIIELYKADIDECPNLCVADNIKELPTMVFFINGKEIYRIVGAKSKSYIEEQIKLQYQNALQLNLLK